MSVASPARGFINSSLSTHAAGAGFGFAMRSKDQQTGVKSVSRSVPRRKPWAQGLDSSDISLVARGVDGPAMYCPSGTFIFVWCRQPTGACYTSDLVERCRLHKRYVNRSLSTSYFLNEQTQGGPSHIRFRQNTRTTRVSADGLAQ